MFRIVGNAKTKRVWINGDELLLEDSLGHIRHSPDGFSWGFGGSGPHQLAYAILLKCAPEDPLKAKEYVAKSYYYKFLSDFVIRLPVGKDFEVILDLDEWFRIQIEKEEEERETKRLEQKDW